MNDDSQQQPSSKPFDSEHPLTKIPILQRVFLFASRKLSAPIKFAAVTSSWDESLRSYGAGALVWKKAYEDKASRVTSFLHLACSKGGVPFVVDHLLQAGVDPNSVDKAGYTALHMIAKWSLLSKHSLECINILLRRGATVDAKTKPKKSSDNQCETALRIAIEIGNAEATAALLKSGADHTMVEVPNGASIVLLAAESGSVETLNCIIAHLETKMPIEKVRSDFVNGRDRSGRTPLIMLAHSGKYFALPTFQELLVNHKADPSIADPNTGSLAFLEFARTASRSSAGAVSTTTAACILPMWIEMYPNIVHQVNQVTGRSCLHYCLEQMHTGSAQWVIEGLIKGGADPNLKDTVSGGTPLHLFVEEVFRNQWDYSKVFRATHNILLEKYLLVAKPDPKVKNADGWNAYEFATEFPWTDEEKEDGKQQQFKREVIGMLREYCGLK